MKTLNLSKEQMEQLNEITQYSDNLEMLGYDSMYSAWREYYEHVIDGGIMLYRYISTQDKEYEEVSEIVELADNELLIFWDNNAVIVDKKEHYSFINKLIEELEAKKELFNSIENQLKKLNELVREYGIIVEPNEKSIYNNKFYFYKGNSWVYSCECFQDFDLDDLLDELREDE